LPRTPSPPPRAPRGANPVPGSRASSWWPRSSSPRADRAARVRRRARGSLRLARRSRSRVPCRHPSRVAQRTDNWQLLLGGRDQVALEAVPLVLSDAIVLLPIAETAEERSVGRRTLRDLAGLTISHHHRVR